MFQSLKKMFGGKKEPVEVLSPVTGKVVALSEVADPTFAQEILGKGVAVIPSEGEFRAPISGEVTVMFETGHAVSIKGDNGAEIIVHIGLDTVQLKGQYFTTHVKQGDRVQAGDRRHLLPHQAEPLVEEVGRVEGVAPHEGLRRGVGGDP